MAAMPTSACDTRPPLQEQIWVTTSTPEGRNDVFLVFSDIGTDVIELDDHERLAIRAAVHEAIQMDAQSALEAEAAWLTDFCARVARDEIDGVRLVATVLSRLTAKLSSGRMEFIGCHCNGGKPSKCRLGLDRTAEALADPKS